MDIEVGLAGVTSINKNIPHIADSEQRKLTEEKYIARYIESIVEETFDCAINFLKIVVFFQ